jgi:hypothetical protein
MRNKFFSGMYKYRVRYGSTSGGFVRCGRESRRTRRLSRSDAFLMGSSIRPHIYRLSYNFPSLSLSRVGELLNFIPHDIELQVECLEVPEDPQTHSTCRSLKLITHHAPSRLSSSSSLSFRRTGFGFSVSFSFYGYHFRFYMISLKTEDLGTFPLPRLINIRLDRLIVWTSRVESHISGVLRACCGSERRQSIEHPDDWITPRAIPVH